MLSFDYSGQNGARGIDGRNGSSGIMGMRGQDGSDAGRGTNATHAKNINLVLRTDGSAKIIINELNQRSLFDNLILGESNNKVNLISNGGHGGHGGTGGNGGRGGDGMSGSNATRYSSGTNGQNGGNGGDGGIGGDGGDGGDGGAITVTADNQDMDLFMLIDQVFYRAGNAGLGGAGGSGGSGGFGGRGGSSYSWSETKNGVTRNYSNPGGYSGMPGFSGRDGASGRDGRPGREGSFAYILDGKQYSFRYNLKVDRVCAIQSDDGIIEPGETLMINAMEVLNVGGMHTPIAQKIALFLQDNLWIYFNPIDTVFIPHSIPIGQVFNITNANPISFKIKDYTKSAIDSVFKQTAVVDYRAKVERINKEFQTVADQTNNYTVRFPVEISPVQLLRSVTLREESPFAISIWNRSTKPIGINHNRLLNFRLILCDTRQTVDFIPKMFEDQDKNYRNSSVWGQNARNQKNFINPSMNENFNYIIEQEFITSIGPNEKKVISGTIKLKDLNLPLYTNIRMQAKLDLGYYHNQAEMFQNIQTRNFHIQLTEGHSFDPNSDFLLVFNCETSSIFIDSVKQFAESFGGNVDLWNISNYQGFNYDYIGPIDKPLSTLYKNKVIIILTNEYTLINSEKTNAMKQIREPHIYKGIKDYKINAYILGPCSNYNEFWLIHPNCDSDSSVNVGDQENELYRQFVSDQKDKEDLNKVDPDEETKKELIGNYLMDCSYTFNFHTSTSCCSNPSDEKIFSKAKSVLNKVDQLNPSYNHILTYTYKPELVKKGIFSQEYNLGKITVIESMRKDAATLIMRNRVQLNETMLDIVDRFCLIKLLSFEKKLNYLQRAMGSFDNAKMVIQAIISDLCDEYVTFQKLPQNNNQLQLNLKMWTQFMKFNFDEALQPFKPTQKKKQIHGGFRSEPGYSNPTSQDPAMPPQMQFSSEPPLPPAPACCEFDGQQPPIVNAQQGINMEQGNYNYPPQMNQMDNNQQQNQLLENIKEINIVEKQDKFEININVQQDQNQDLQNMNMPPPVIGISLDAAAATLPQPDMQQQVASEQEILISNKVRNYLIDYLIHFEAALKKQISFGQKCCCSITAKVNSHCRTIIESVLLRKLQIRSEQLKQQALAYFKELEQKNKNDVFELYQAPHKEMNRAIKNSDYVKQNNLILQSTPYRTRDFPHFNFNKDEHVYIQDGSFIFTNELTQEINFQKRLNKIERFENQIRFEKD